jgi:glycosyltransferase involved in cell wall biosynthesis
MRIAVVGPAHPFRGGIAHHTTLLAGALHQRHEVLFLSFRAQYPDWAFPGRSDRDPSMPTGDVAVEHVLSPAWPPSWWRTVRRLRAFGPRVTIIPWWVPFWAPSVGTVARALHRWRCGGVLFVCHNVIPHERSRVDRRLAAYALSAGDAFIVHSATDEATLRSVLGRGAAGQAAIRRAVLPDHAIAAPVDRADARRQLGLRPSDRVALFFGFVRPYKGLEHLIRATALASTSVPDLRLLVAGEFWQPADGFRQLAARLGLAAQVTLDDRYVPNEEVAPYFCAADVVVLPYLQATQSGVVTLASRFGVPVIAARVGGLPETVAHGQTGLLVPPGDDEALAEALRRVLTDDALANRLRAGVTAGRWRFEWATLVALVEELAALPAFWGATPPALSAQGC